MRGVNELMGRNGRSEGGALEGATGQGTRGKEVRPGYDANERKMRM